MCLNKLSHCKMAVLQDSCQIVHKSIKALVTVTFNAHELPSTVKLLALASLWGI